MSYPRLSGPARRRLLVVALGFFLVLVLIAAFVRDAVIRPYGGDVLVMVFLFLLVRGISAWPRAIVAGLVLAVAALVEFGQALGLLEILRLDGIRLARIVFGQTPDALDVVLYGIGTGIAVLVDQALLRSRRQ